MNTQLSLRWLYGACYEIRLPNGKVIITDPDISRSNPGGHTLDEVTGADYILCSHTHYDHTSDIGKLFEKFDGKIIVGAMSAVPLARAYDLNLTAVWPMNSGETVKFEDFTLTARRAHHLYMPFPDNRPSLVHKQPGPEGSDGSCRDCSEVGGLELLDFAITTKENMRIYFSAGISYCEEIYDFCRSFRPNILIKQVILPDLPRRCTIEMMRGQKIELGEKQTSAFAEAARRIGAQYVLPNHHEHMSAERGMSVEQYLAGAQEYLDVHGSHIQTVNPEMFRCYDITLGFCPRG